MTELEALRLVRAMAHAFSTEKVLEALTRKGVSVVDIEGGGVEGSARGSAWKDAGGAAAQQDTALDLLDALILCLEEATAEPWKALRMAETVMREHGEVVLATASAERVREVLMREVLIDNGLEAFAATLSDADLGWQLEAVRGKWDLPMGFGDWRSELEWRAAEWIAEANGHTWPG